MVKLPHCPKCDKKLDPDDLRPNYIDGESFTNFDFCTGCQSMVVAKWKV